jgi:HEAT repeat protein
MITPEDLAALSGDPYPFLDHPDAAVRRLAVSVSAANPQRDGLPDRLSRLLRSDESARVRAEAAEVLAATGPEALDTLLAATGDEDPIVVEAAATGLGEIADATAVPWLIDAARGHTDRLVREAAVAALGACGDERALPILLDLVANGPPQIRRRSVVALTVFDDPAVEPAIRAALEDRNPMVREAAEMVVGRPLQRPPGSQ